MSSKLIKQDDSYRNWIQGVSKRFRQSQLKAAIKVNSEMLRFYWMLGKDISSMSLDAKYGTGFYQSVSSDLQEIFPDVHSFSVTNLKYMRYFYELYSNIENHPQLGDDLKDKQRGCNKIGPLSASERMPIFLSIKEKRDPERPLLLV